MTPQELLQKYWKHDHFRPLQQEIIQSVLSQKDTVALLPTGGGKSICFQIPALSLPGICLVVSPLIALMKDQVANLQKRDIKALSLTGTRNEDEVSDLLDNARFGHYKFLYLSPERLQNDWIVSRLKELPINLIAIDEAHCVSQWGHDFRPAYLKIAGLREHFPKVPFLALTASATKRVEEDLATQLQLRQPAVFRQSFARENIAYMVLETEDKLFKTTQILRKHPQPAIIYVRNRKACHEISGQLEKLGLGATFYHGGLSHAQKQDNMQGWMDGKAQVMVATNAFGMGIDKANVRTVIHWQLPENLENYYQEAGRAGRDGNRAHAVLLLAPSDAGVARNQFLAGLPDRAFVLEVYVKLCNLLQIAYGEGMDEDFAFNLNQFCVRYNFPTVRAFNALQFLDRQGVLNLSTEFSEKATLQFTIESKEVLRYMSLNPADEPVVQALVRTYPGIYEMALPLNPALIAKKASATEAQVLAILHKMHERGMVSLQVRNNDARVRFNEIREDEKTINRIAKYLESQNKLKKEQLEAVLDYATNSSRCKSRLLLDYFGETATKDCGICSYCIQKRPEVSVNPPHKKILQALTTGNMDSRALQDLCDCPAEALIFALRELLEREVIALLPNNQYTLLK